MMQPDRQKNTSCGSDYTKSVISPGRERYRPEALWKPPVLPVTFLVGGGRAEGECLGKGAQGVVGGMRGVTGNVGGCSGVTRGAGGGTGRTPVGVAGCRVSGKSGGAHLAHRDLTAHPATPCLQCIPRSFVFGMLLLEVGEYALGALDGPENQ